MAEITILDAVKKSLRLSATTAFDDDVTELIEACKLDLGNAGVVNIDEDDYLVRQAIKLYCRANFQLGAVQDAQYHQKHYDMLKLTMGFDSRYNTVPEVNADGNS